MILEIHRYRHRSRHAPQFSAFCLEDNASSNPPSPLFTRFVETHSLRSEAGLLYRTQGQDDYGLV